MNEILQSVPFAVVLLVIGFVFLVKGADAFVEGCSSVAKRFHVPTLIIGMTIVAMGTAFRRPQSASRLPFPETMLWPSATPWVPTFSI